MSDATASPLIVDDIRAAEVGSVGKLLLMPLAVASKSEDDALVQVGDLTLRRGHVESPIPPPGPGIQNDGTQAQLDATVRYFTDVRE